MRHLIAYGLILLLVLGGVAGALLLRHNQADRRIARQRARQRKAREDRFG